MKFGLFYLFSDFWNIRNANSSAMKFGLFYLFSDFGNIPQRQLFRDEVRTALLFQ
jgi:hypothetical protein